MNCFRKQNLTVTLLSIFAVVQIVYNVLALFYLVGLKIYMSPKINNEVLRLESTLTRVDLNLGGLDIRIFMDNMDFGTFRDILYGSLWYIFVIDLIGVFINLSLLFCLLMGVRQGDIKLMMYWLIYGLLSFCISISLFPLKTAVCGAAEPKYVYIYLGSICRSILGQNIWLYIIIQLIWITAVILTFLHRRKVVHENRNQNNNIQILNDPPNKSQSPQCLSLI